MLYFEAVETFVIELDLTGLFTLLLVAVDTKVGIEMKTPDSSISTVDLPFNCRNATSLDKEVDSFEVLIENEIGASVTVCLSSISDASDKPKLTLISLA